MRNRKGARVTETTVSKGERGGAESPPPTRHLHQRSLLPPVPTKD